MPDTLAAQRLRRLAARARTLAIFYLAALFVSTHIPMPEGSLSSSDKWCHFGGYALLTLCVLAGWELSIGVLEARHYFAVWLVGVLYAAFDEVTQIPVGRQCDPNDWMADVLGIVAGLLAFRVARRAYYWILAGGRPLSLGKP
jgi:VanZ family protein